MKTEFLDARHLLCPLPVIRTQDKVKTLSVGDRLQVACTDPGVMQDIPAWCRIHGHRLILAEETGEDYLIELEVGVGATKLARSSDHSVSSKP